MDDIRIGTAAWALPAAVRAAFPGAGSLLERYARRLSCVEVNSTFYRPHRPATFARWAASVPAGFRFALKVPREITHVRRLADAGDALGAFLESSAELGAKRDVLLVQLPPSLALEPAIAERFFARLRALYAGRIACEARHATWFAAEGGALFQRFDVARVAADPPAGGLPALASLATGPFTYLRLHGSPRIYASAYEGEEIAVYARALRDAPRPAWCIFDNTAFGAATANALEMLAAVGQRRR